jgi:hypothetical protein
MSGSRLRLTGALLFSGLAAGTAAAAESAYQKLDFDRDCTEISADELGGSWSCKGFGEYEILFAEGDLRQSVFYGEVGDWFAAGAFESFGAFNRAGEMIEWRLQRGRPFATIRRWFLQPAEDGGAAGELQILVVSKVGQPGEGEACVVGYVDARATPKANEVARRVADREAADFACRIDEPRWHGAPEPEGASPSRSFGE